MYRSHAITRRHVSWRILCFLITATRVRDIVCSNYTVSFWLPTGMLNDTVDEIMARTGVAKNLKANQTLTVEHNVFPRWPFRVNLLREKPHCPIWTSTCRRRRRPCTRQDRRNDITGGVIEESQYRLYTVACTSMVRRAAVNAPPHGRRRRSVQDHRGDRNAARVSRLRTVGTISSASAVAFLITRPITGCDD